MTLKVRKVNINYIILHVYYWSKNHIMCYSKAQKLCPKAHMIYLILIP